MTGEGRMGPVHCLGGNDVGVAHERERRAAAGSRDARDQVRTFGIAGDDLAVDAGALQIVL
jgi:hypothetical protein